MTEPSVEEIVARWEQQPGAIISQHEIDRIIASWRERGEALKARDELIARMWLEAPLPAKEDEP